MSQVENTFFDGESAPAREVGGIANLLVRVLTVAMLILGINHTFNLSTAIGFTPVLNQYLYGVLALSVPIAFLLFPATPKGAGKGPSILDWTLCIVAVVTLGYFIVNAY